MAVSPAQAAALGDALAPPPAESQVNKRKRREQETTENSGSGSRLWRLLLPRTRISR
jgi:hypothetical protein